MSPENSFRSKYSVLSYFFLTFIISWGAIFLLFGAEGIPATDDTKEIIGMTILLGPTIASLVLTALYEGRKGFKQLGERLICCKVLFQWYLVALLTAPVSTLLAVGLFSMFVGQKSLPVLTNEDPLNLLVLALIGGITVALFEELGWTGFATPQLRKRKGIVTTGLLIGLVWGAWHFILFWEANSFSETIPFILLLARLFSWLPAYRILMVWLFDRTQSLLMVILMHISLVASLVLFDPILEGTDLIIFILIRAVILWLLVALVSYRKIAGKN